MPFLIVAHVVVAIAVPWVLGRHGRAMAWCAAAVPAATAGWAAFRLGTVEAGHEVTASVEWAPALGLVPDFRLDALAAVMLLLVGGVGALVLVYSAWYFPRPSRLMIGSLTAFAGAMTGLVLADNLLVLYVFWELTTISSFVLIGGGHPEREEFRRAAIQALVMTTGFGLVMLAGFVVLGEAAGTYRISALVADPPGGAAVTAALVLVLLGAFAKSAQVPLHSWLPVAMVAPTPVSAYLHAAAMVKAGVYLVARLAPAFAESGVWRPLTVGVGLTSLFVGGLVALRQDDLKLLLAYGTVSQLGMLMVLFGAGTRTAALAGGALLLAHGLFKAPLFLTVGVLEEETGTRSARRLAGTGLRMPVLAVAATAAAASMIGLPPFLGFVAKEAALTAFTHGGVADLAILAAMVAGSVLTVAYSLRFLRAAFRGDGTGRSRASPGLVGPIVVLACGGFALGLVPHGVDEVIAPYAGALDAPEPGYELALWHGLGLPIVLSALVVAAGLGLHVAVDQYPSRRSALSSWLPRGQAGYDDAVRTVVFAGRVVTRHLQVGSLPAYLTMIALTVLAVPGTALVAGLAVGDGPDAIVQRLRLWDDPAQLVLAAIVIGCAVAASWVGRRLSAVLLLAGVGYGTGGLFVVNGAPDLALTLLVVETLSLIMLVLVLRKLPAAFPPSRRSRRAGVVTGLISVSLGAFVAVFLVVAALSRDRAPVGPAYVRPAAEDKAKNVVNAILVDFRALDTLGEIAVLAVAAVGVGGLVLTGPGAGRRRRRLPRPHVPQGERTEIAPSTGPETEPETVEARTRWLAAPGPPPLGGHSVLLDAIARVLGPTILVFSAYLLFAGHNSPGGGFVGGLVAGTAIVLRYLAGGRRELAAADPVPPRVLLGGGLMLAVGAGTAGWASGSAFLRNETFHDTVPVLGEVHLSTGLVFDLGVYFLVLGLVLAILSTLGASLEDDSGAAPSMAAEDGADRWRP